MRAPIAVVVSWLVLDRLFTVIADHQGLLAPFGPVHLAPAVLGLVVILLRLAVTFLVLPWAAWRITRAEARPTGQAVGMRRVVVVVSLVVLGLAAWWARREQPAPVRQPAVPLPELPFEVFGRLVDAEGAPVEGAEVALFGERETWQRRYDSFFATRETDEGRDCAALTR